jgi:hypothetical protein
MMLFRSDPRSSRRTTRDDGPRVGSAVAMLLHPTSGVVLKTAKPHLWVAGFHLRSLNLRERRAARLSISRFRHVLGKFACGSRHRKIQPAWGQYERKLVRVAKLETVTPCFFAQYRECRKPRAVGTKEQAHDLRTEANVFLPLGTLDVWTRKILQIMQEECCPKAGIPGKAPSDPPSDRNEEGVYEEAVRPERDLNHNFAYK